MKECLKKGSKLMATTKRHSIDVARIQKPMRQSLKTTTPDSNLSDLSPNAFSSYIDKVMKYMHSRSTSRTTLKVLNAFGEKVMQIFWHLKEELDSAIPMSEREQMIMGLIGPGV